MNQTRWLKAIVLGVGIALFFAACEDSEKAPGVSSETDLDASVSECVDLDNDGYGKGCRRGKDCDDNDPTVTNACFSCFHSQTEGCSCEPGTEPVVCYLDPKEGDAGQTICYEGTRYCRNGKWTGCESVRNYTVSASSSAKVIVPDSGLKNCNNCYVNCYEVTDPMDPTDGGLNDANCELGNIAWGDGGGITLAVIQSGDGGVGDAGGTPAACVVGTDPTDMDCDGIPDLYDPYPAVKPFQTDNEAIFFHLGPGQVGTSAIDLQFFLKTADIYFLLDQTGSMAEERVNLQAGLTSGTYLGSDVECADTDFDGIPNNELKSQGVIGAIRCLIRDAWFGAGFHRELPFLHSDDWDQITFRNYQDITSNVAAARAAVNRMVTIGNSEGWPEAHSQALWSIATGGGLYMGYNYSGVPPRQDCPAGTWGYPCFRDDAVPIIILFTDAMFHNGPANAASSSGYAYAASYPLTRGTTAAYVPVPNTNEDFTNIFDLGDVTSTFVTYTGDTWSMSPNIPASTVGCSSNIDANDAVFKFSLSATKTVVLNTSGSDYDTVLSLHSGIPSSPSTSVAVSGNETHASAKNIGNIYNGWFVGTGSTASMSGDYQGSTVDCNANTSGKDAVYAFSLSAATDVTVDTAGSAFDTVLSLHSGTPPLRPTPTAVDNTNDKQATAYSVGNLNGQYKVYSGSTNAAGIVADYSEAVVGCSADTASPDAVYSFSLTQPTRVRIDTEDSSYDTVLSLFKGSLGSVTKPAATPIGTLGESEPAAYNAGTIDGQWKVFSGNTSTMNDHIDGVACGSDNSSRDAFIKFTLASQRTVTIDTVGSGYNTVIGLYNWAKKKGSMKFTWITCDNNSGGGTDSQITRTLNAGTYYVIIKGVSFEAGGAYQLSIKDNAVVTTGQCDNDNGPGTTSLLELDLTAATYYVVVKGNASGDKGNYTVTFRDVTSLPNNRASCNDDASGTASSISAALSAGNYYAVVKSKAAGVSGNYQISVRDATHTGVTLRLTCDDDSGSGATSRISTSLAAGTYYVVLKGKTATAEGAYQLSVGAGSTSSGTFAPKTWTETGTALQDKGIKIMSVLSCEGRDDCDETRSQAETIATVTGALGDSSEPLVFDINSDGSGLDITVVDGVRKLADYMTMDVSVGVVYSPDANPGFLFTAEAIDKAGDSCGPPAPVAGIPEHKNCLPGAVPNFRVSFTNPINSPVAANPNDPNGGYNFKVELIGDGKYVLDSIPVYIIPTTPPSNYVPAAVYWQDIYAGGCKGNDLPDWSDLTWVATLPEGTSIQYEACAAETQTGLDTCTFSTVATVRASGSCTDSSQCANGYCGSNGLCQYITGTSCTSDAQCASSAVCINNLCTYAEQPADIAAAIALGNHWPYLRLRITLNANSTHSYAPTLYKWTATYVCSSEV
jgi:hypothetical protein